MVRRLLMLNGIAIVCVVLFHASGWGFTAMFSWAHRYLPVTSPNYDQVGSLSYYGLRLVEQLAQFSIPAFLFVSGFFVAFMTGKKRETVAWSVIASRIKFLIIPYLVWSALLIVGGLLQGRSYTAASLLRMVLTGSTNPAYYFVPLLIQFYLISPLLIPLVRKRGWLLLALTGLMQIFVYAIQYPVVTGSDNALLLGAAQLLPKWFFMMRIFWFTLGIFVGFHLADIRGWLVRLRPLLLALLPVLFVIGFFEWEALVRLSGQPWIETRETLVDGLYALVFLLVFIAYSDNNLPVSKPLEELGSRSFGIYLVHSPVMEYFSRAVYHFIPALLGAQILLQPMLIGLGLLVPLVFMYLVRRSPARPYYAYLFG
jgi:peptidoglycan/LPS O-acetylase OafA/YrhL